MSATRVGLKGAIQYTVMISAVSTLIGCSATQTVLEHHTLEVSTQLSKTIFLDPVPFSQKTVFVSVKNTSEERLTIEKPLVQALVNKGYRVVSNPSQAHYMLQANILKVGKMSESASQKALGGGYGSALAGAATGAAIGSFGNTHTVIGGGMAGGLIGIAADSLVKDVNYTMITDIQISERAAKGVKVREHFKSELDNGSASKSYQTSSHDSAFERYRLRVVSTANKVNLSFPTARPALEQGLVRTLEGLF